MNPTKRTMALALAVAMIAGLAVAQGQQQQPQQQQPQQQPGQQQQMAGAYHPTLEPADQLIGMDVKNSEGNNLGMLSDIVLEPNLNYISYGVLTRGGIVGLGEKHFAIPWDMFQFGPERKTLVLNIPQEALEKAQGFSKTHWPDRADQRWRMQVMGRPQQPAQRKPAEQPQTWREQQWREQQQWGQQQPQPQAMSRQQGQVYGRPEQQQPQTAPQQQQKQPLEAPETQKGFQERRITRLLGMDVKSASQQQQLGRLSDVVLDFHQGLVAYALVGLGGGKEAAVPWSAVEILPQKRLALIDTNRQALEQMAFAKDNMPDLANPQYAQRLYTQFNRQPYWEALGFVGTGSQAQPQQQQQMQPLTRHFNPQNVTVISGTVQSVGTFPERELGIQGRRLTILTQDGQTVDVHTGPAGYLKQQGLTLQKNEKVQVRGSFAQIMGRTIFIASDIKTPQMTVKLRDQQGVPLWRGQRMNRSQQQPQQF